ncbi:MAG: alanine dehydrogenase [Deltaproteobacteria bacterium]|nr:alanine dehydrogenase [Deltaproteobacteria bacterium]
MFIGVPREPDPHEHRVGLNPSAVARLVEQGHTVYVETGAGEAAHFSDTDYEKAGAGIVFSHEEAFQRADFVCRIGRIRTAELDLLRKGQVLCAFHHLAVASRERVQKLMDLEVTLLGYEVIRDAAGELPVLIPFSEMAGQMAVHIGAQYLRTDAGGRGILLGNVAGVPPPTVLVVGAGTLGRTACRMALATGAHVIVLDQEMAKLRQVNRENRGRAVTALAALTSLEQYTAIADLVIGAVLVPGARSPFLVSEKMVKSMKKGSVIVDLSIDQGGCVETSRPTTLDRPTYSVHDVVHYCVPNVTTSIPRTATRALINAALPYLLAHGDKGLRQAMGDEPGLAHGVYLYRGKLLHRSLGDGLGLPVTPLAQILQEA